MILTRRTLLAGAVGVAALLCHAVALGQASSAAVGASAAARAMGAAPAAAPDPLPSWNDGPAKRSIIAFVEKVTREGSPDFVPAPERTAVFDNDGTLWCEKPMPVQLCFVIDRVKSLAPERPEWKDKEPFASILRGDPKGLMAGGERGLVDS